MQPAPFSFPGGIHPETHKARTRDVASAPAPLPAQLFVPLQDKGRAPGRLLAQAGERVLKGQRLADAADQFSAAIHAPTSGELRAIAPHPLAQVGGGEGLCAHIVPDGKEEWAPHAPFDLQSATREAALRHLRDSGIVGLGGAAFPSHVKLGDGRQIRTLVLNGAECEPWITCDDRLMRERAAAIVRGAQMLAQLSGAAEIRVGIEDNKPEALAAMEAASAGQTNVQIFAVPTRYPAGGEKQLIEALTGIRIPAGQYGPQHGVQCFNVGTAYAVARAIEHGEPLISRLVTLTGAVRRPANVEALIGTPLADLLALAEPESNVTRTILGGPMMGVAVENLAAPLPKHGNCLIAADDALFPPRPAPSPCIRCTSCAQACPQRLQPFELYWYAQAREFDKLARYRLFDCIECGACAWVCPAHLPLVDYYRFAKDEIRARERERQAADSARQRFEWRTFRLAREKEEKAARLKARAAETLSQMNREGSPPEAAQTDKQALIAAAVARAAAQKAAAETPPAPPPTEEPQP